MENLEKTEQEIAPVELPKTVLLVNNFVYTTTEFLNNFVEVCEKRIVNVSDKLSNLEIQVQVLEAKLGSLPVDATNSTTSKPTTAPTPPSTSNNTDTASTNATPPPPPAPNGAPPPPSSTNLEAPAVVQEEPKIEAEPAEPVDDGMCEAREHPTYKKFFKLAEMGAPKAQVQMQMGMAGLDATILDTPFERIPRDD